MRPVIVDSTGGDGTLAVDWIRTDAIAGSGTFTSAVFDATDTVLWQKLATTSRRAGAGRPRRWPIGAATPTPDDGTWTAFAAPGGGWRVVGIFALHPVQDSDQHIVRRQKSPVIQ